MKRKLLFAVLAIVLLVAAGYFGYGRYRDSRGRARLRDAQAAVQARLAGPASDTDLPVTAIAGTFVILRENTITIRIEEQVTSEGVSFINYREWTASTYHETDVLRYVADPSSPNGIRTVPAQISSIRAGERVAVYYRQNSAGAQAVAIHILY